MSKSLEEIIPTLSDVELLEELELTNVPSHTGLLEAEARRRGLRPTIEELEESDRS